MDLYFFCSLITELDNKSLVKSLNTFNIDVEKKYHHFCFMNQETGKPTITSLLFLTPLPTYSYT